MLVTVAVRSTGEIDEEVRAVADISNGRPSRIVLSVCWF